MRVLHWGLYALFGLTVSVAVAACGDTIAATEVIVTIDADPTMRADLDQVNVRVLSGGDADDDGKVRLNQDFGNSTAIDWPITLVVSPLNRDANRTFELIAEGSDSSGETISRVRAVTGFVAKQTRHLSLTFTASCRDLLCSTDETCQAGKCIAADNHDLKNMPEPTGGSINATGGDDTATGTGGSSNGTGGEDAATGGSSNVTGGEDTATGGNINATGREDTATGGKENNDCTGIWNTGLFGQACWGE